MNKNILIQTMMLGVFIIAGCAGQMAETKTAEPSEKAMTGFMSDAKPDGKEEWRDGQLLLNLNGEKITYADLTDVWAIMNPTRKPLGEFPEPEQKRFVNRYFITRLFADGAVLEGLDKTPEFNAELRGILFTRLVPIYRKIEVEDKIRPSDDELLTYLPPALDEVRVQVVTSEKLEEAREVYRRVTEGGEDFQKVSDEMAVRLRRVGVSATTDFMSVRTKGNFPPPTIQRFLDAPEGAVLEPFFNDVGFAVVRILEKRSAEEVRKNALDFERSNILETYFYGPAYNKRLEELMASSKVVVHKEVLEALEQKEGDPKAVALEVNGEKFTGGEVFGDLTYVSSHEKGVADKRAAEFATKAIIGQEALKIGLDKLPEFAPALKMARLLALHRLVVQKVTSDVDAAGLTDEDYRGYIERNPDKAFMPEKRRLSVIMVHDEPAAAKVMEKLKNGADFAALAKEFSKHIDSAAKGGDLGFLTADVVPEVVREQAFALEVGQYTQPVYAEGTRNEPLWLIVKVEEVEKRAPKDPEWVKSPTYQQRIITEKKTKALEDKGLEFFRKLGYRICSSPLDRKECR